MIVLAAALSPTRGLAAVNIVNGVRVDSLAEGYSRVVVSFAAEAPAGLQMSAPGALLGGESAAFLLASPQGLADFTRQLVSAAAGPRGFATLPGQRSSYIASFGGAPFPKGSRVFFVRGRDPIRDFRLVINAGRAFVVYVPGGYFERWEPAPQRLARAEGIIESVLRGYEKRTLRNGVLYSAAERPTVELLVTEGTPWETDLASYDVTMLVFPVGVPALTLKAPCDFWTVPRPIGWRPKSARTCQATWIRVDSH